MGKIGLLVDTDIFIDYFNSGLFSGILEDKRFTIYYSVVTEKELLSKKGLKTTERDAIIYTLKKHRRVRVNDKIAFLYSELQGQYPKLDKEDVLIAATAMSKGLPVMTRNLKHFKKIKGLSILENT